MTEIGYYQYEGWDLRTKFGWLNGAPGIQATDRARIGMGSLGNAFGASDQTVRGLLAPLGIEWRGAAADATAEALRKAADRAGNTGGVANGGGAAVDGYGQSFEALRPKVAFQDPGTWDWYEIPIDAAGIVLDSAFGDVFDVQSDFRAAIEQNRTLDAQANEALRGHEEQARAALAAFPMIEQAPATPPPGPPPGFTGVGPGVPPVGPNAVPPVPIGPEPVGIAPAGVAPPGGPGAVPPGLDAGGPARAVPPPGLEPGALNRTAPGATPTGIPPGGPNPAAPGAPIPPGRVVPSDVLTAPAARDTGLPPNRQPGIPERALPPLGTAPGGPGTGPNPGPNLAPNPGVGPGGGPRPAPGPGVTPYRTPGDLGRSGPPGTGPFPGGRPTGGGEFGSRLPTGTPEQAATGRPGGPGAPPGGTRGVPGAMPMMGGMGAGAGGSTEHRSKYRILSSEPFEVGLPPHTEPVIEGRYG